MSAGDFSHLTAVLGNVPAQPSSAICRSTGIGVHDVPLHETGRMSSEKQMSISNPYMAHRDSSTDVASINNLNVDAAIIDEDDGEASREAPGPHFHRPSTPIRDEKFFPHGPEMAIEGDDGIETEHLSSATKTDDTTTARYMREELHPAHTTDAKYKCVTQTHGYAEVRIGFGGQIPRWRKGSELSYVVCKETFPHPLSDLVEDAMRAAIDMWQGIGVSFKQVRRDDPATFAVTYQKWNKRVYACSFFPNESSRDLTVFSNSLEKPDFLANILAHEIGHILGLRHEFAHEKESEQPSILVGEQNPQSVMNYFEHLGQLQVNQQDLDGLQRLYACDQSEYELPILDIDPEARPFSRGNEYLPDDGDDMERQEYWDAGVRSYPEEPRPPLRREPVVSGAFVGVII